MNDELIKQYVNDMVKDNALEWNMNDGNICMNGNIFRATPWRYETKLKALHFLSVEYAAVGEICSYKATRVEAKNANIFEILYSELDICEWLVDDEIASVYALSNQDKTMSLIIKTKKDILCTIDIATTLSEETMPIIKHEIVGKGGFISDRCINEHIPSMDIYVFEEDKKSPATYMAPDLSISGLAPEEVFISENVIDILTNTKPSDVAFMRHNKILYYIDCVYRSIERGEVIKTEVTK